MIDLTNKNINELLEKHKLLLQDLHPDHRPPMAYIIDIAIPHIQTVHTPLKPEWKAWVIMVLRKLQDKNALTSEQDIIKYIDDFVKFANENYVAFLADVAMSVSDYDRDYTFILKYLKSIGIDTRNN